MKTILVPTDFSETAANAINYAAALAMFTKSKLLLFHAEYIPILVSEGGMEITEDNFRLTESMDDDRMKLIMEGIQKTYGKDLVTDFCSSSGFIIDEITLIAKEKKCDLIIMGTHGASGMNKFFGSNTAGVIKQTACPVLAIPDKVKFKKIDKIVFASDYMEIKNKSIFNPLLEIASLFNSEVSIFNMDDNSVHEPSDKERESIALESVFKNVKHTYFFSEQKNIVAAINEFADNNHAVLVTMIRRQHNLFHQLFAKSNTRLMVLYTHFPLLILNEEIKTKEPD